MRVPADQLARHLAGTLAPLYLITGDEPLGMLEAEDAVRAAARREGCAERVVLTVEQGRLDTTALAEARSNLSLFSTRRLIEIRIPTGKPGQDGARTLEAYAGNLPPDTFTLVSLPLVDAKTRQARWFAALERAGVVVEAQMPPREALPAWVSRQLGRRGLQPSPEAAELLASRVEGNLVAAAQEFDKLALVLPPGAVGVDAVRAAVADVSRLEADALPEVLYAGDTARMVRTLEHLRAAGEAVPAFLWQLASAVTLLLKLSATPAARRDLARTLWGRDLAHAPLIARALDRLPRARLETLLMLLARADRESKGLDPAGDAWDTLFTLARLAGTPPQPLPHRHGH